MYNEDSKQRELEGTHDTIPWKVYEKTCVMNEVREKRKDRIIVILIIILSVMIVLFAVNNAMWLYYWNQYEYIDEDSSIDIDASQDGGGVNIIGGGDIDYGTDSNDKD